MKLQDKEEFCVSQALAIACGYLLSEAFHDLVKKKKDLRFYLTQVVHSNGRNTLSLMNELFIKVSIVHQTTLNFSSRKNLCVSACINELLANCLLSETL